MLGQFKLAGILRIIRRFQAMQVILQFIGGGQPLAQAVSITELDIKGIV